MNGDIFRHRDCLKINFPFTICKNATVGNIKNGGLNREIGLHGLMEQWSKTGDMYKES